MPVSGLDHHPTGRVSGPTRFARYAYPPNTLGLCGPEDHQALLEYAAAGCVDGGLIDLARGFEGAWPYLELLAGAAGIDDPLADDVVEAYWVGSALSDRVTTADLGNHLDDRFRRRAGGSWERIEDALCSGAGVCHQFHVFAVYPWVGLLRSGAHDQALHVLDRCRIRWGRVLEIDGPSAIVRSAPLCFDDDALVLGAPRDEVVQVARAQHRLDASVAAGDLVSLHWDWICERISSRQVDQLRRRTAHHLTRAGQETSVRDRGAAGFWT